MHLFVEERRIVIEKGAPNGLNRSGRNFAFFDGRDLTYIQSQSCVILMELKEIGNSDWRSYWPIAVVVPN